ncbi:hypothetical protein LGM89_23075 [Burkholderia sp. AU31624]|uniref:hypothetical protein n=1 Tax=Burkholderia sp. AU31624 TaxID=2879629 RepID=UPI001CF39D1B|nr:hypothetical protein [Burkholderia sp. AU31624]MCA8256154.1 hypothetical protein [Burkholderia sp. AU31624]
MTERAVGVVRACGPGGMSRSLVHDESHRRIDDEALTGWMMAIAAQKRRYDRRSGRTIRLVSGGPAFGRRFRCLNVVDDYTCECLVIEIDTSLPG